jgi:hypothetical protein
MKKAKGTAVTKINNIQLQTSSYGLGLAIQYGANRGTGNLIWYANFKAIPHTEKVKAGKSPLGGGSYKNTTYTYSAAVIMALGEGPITRIGKVWKDKEETTLQALGLTLFVGNHRQAPWGFAQGYNVPANWDREATLGYAMRAIVDGVMEKTTPDYVNQTLGYDTTAYLASAAYDLGEQASVPNHSFEIFGFHPFSDSIPDSNPKDVIVDFLTSGDHGVGMAPGRIGDLTQYSDYCVASGILFSPRVEQVQAASDYLSEWLDITNSDALWSEGKLKILPRGDKTVTGNGVTFVPELQPIYDIILQDLGDDGEGPLKISRKTPADAFNRIPIEVVNRANSYVTEVVTAEDQEAIERYGLRQADSETYDSITDPNVGRVVAQLRLNRLLFRRNEYEFSLDGRFALLEPGDYITLTYEAYGMDRVLVKITEMEEEGEGFMMRCEDTLVGIAQAPVYDHYSGLHFSPSYNDLPTNPAIPHIFELPGDPTTTGLSVGIATGRYQGDVLYGGCYVWVSVDGVSYQLIKTLEGSSIYGKLQTSIDADDTAMTIKLESGGQLQSVTAENADRELSLITVDEEYISYETVQLIAADTYVLSGLRRGLKGTTPAVHDTGKFVSRIDDGIARLDNMETNLIGTTLFIKLTAFNIYKSGEVSLEDVNPYTYVVDGYMEALAAKDLVTGIGEDGILHPVEKQQIIREWQDRVNERPTLDARADALGIVDEKNAYDAAYDDLWTYLTSLSPSWNDTSAQTEIDRTTWNLKWTTLIDKRQDLTDKVVRQTANWQNVWGSGKPQDGATVGAPVGTPVGDRDAQDVVDQLDFNADTMALELAIGANHRALMDSRTLLAGKDVATVISETKEELRLENLAIAQTLTLIGASVNDGEAFQFNLNTVRVSDTESLSQRLESTAASLGPDGLGGKIESLENVLVDPSGVTVRAIFTMDANGYLAGSVATNTGTISSMKFRYDQFQIVSSDGSGQLFTPFEIDGNIVRLTNVEADTFKVKSINIEALAPGLSSAPRYVANDVAINSSSSETTVIETPNISLGASDVVGSALGIFSCSADGQPNKDAGIRFRVYVDTGNGYGLIKIFDAGIRTNGGDTGWVMPVAKPVSVSAAGTIKIKVTAITISISGGGINNGTVCRDVAIDLLKVGR